MAHIEAGFNGTYNHWTAKHFDRYVNEFAGRHNAHGRPDERTGGRSSRKAHDVLRVGKVLWAKRTARQTSPSS